jgi:MoxR-like ATPase
MSYFSDAQIDRALTYLKGATHTTLTSLLALWRADAPVAGTGASIPFGARQENQLLSEYFAPEGGPPSHPFYVPFHADQGKSRWRDRGYAGSSLQRQRKDTEEIFEQDASDRKRWSLAPGYVQAILAKPFGQPPISLPALAAWLFRGRDFSTLQEAVDTLIDEFKLDRDGLIGTAGSSSVFTRADLAQVDSPKASQPVDPGSLLALLASHSPPPATSDAVADDAGGSINAPSVIDPDLLEGSWDFDLQRLEALGTLEGLYEQAFSAAAALRRGKHVIFVGPPGTGKTTLAEHLCQAAEIPYATASATDQWTTFETIGGYFPMPSGESGTEERLDFLPGLMLDAIQTKRCLIVDELNRADMDKAFGELFTLLTGQSVTLPFRMRTPTGFHRIRLMPKPGLVEADVHGIGVPSWWRLLGAMNDADKGGIKRLSTAFKRRFATVVVPLPDSGTYTSVLRTAAEAAAVPDEAPFEQLVDILVEMFATAGSGFASIGHPMGPAIPLSMIKAAAAEWTMDASRSLETVLNSILETDVASIIATTPQRLGDAVGLVQQHIQGTERFERAMETWTGR